ncbi:MAG: 1,4-dihydroxy-2-naphthoate polyprenyltransferase [Ignavibacteriae bacterium]|nr:1,4-dihydroxy-2-naphthoate polyprenyltransferase [Ignavibacteriota bacterium]
MFKIWIGALRLKTLPASVIPVLIGTAMAYYDGYFNLLTLLLTFICALLIQVITNFLNEVYDSRRGADTPERLGPRRAVALGLIKPALMIKVVTVLVLVTLILGNYLVLNGGGVFIFIIGLISLFFAWAYTGGPYPIAYKGLSDIFVLIFFGIVAVTGTYYLQAHRLIPEVLIASLAPGFLSMNILGVNNIRDIETDRKAGKMTLAVRIGERASKILYVVINLSAFIVPVILYYTLDNAYFLLPLLVFPISILICLNLFRSSGARLNRILAQTGMLLVLYGIASSILFFIK